MGLCSSSSAPKEGSADMKAIGAGDGAKNKAPGGGGGGGKSVPGSGGGGSAMGQKFHSAIRWGKTVEVQEMLGMDKTLVNVVDEKNGNRPIHLASQNGHIDLVKLLIEHGADVNLANHNQQTALHMAREYDYYWTAKCLLEAGADGTLVNADGHAADTGIEGGKSAQDFVPALQDAKTKEQVMFALNGIAKQESVDRAEVVKAVMNLRKIDPALRDDEVNAKIKEVM